MTVTLLQCKATLQPGSLTQQHYTLLDKLTHSSAQQAHYNLPLSKSTN